VAYFKLLFRYLPGRTENNHKNPLSGQPESNPEITTWDLFNKKQEFHPSHEEHANHNLVPFMAIWET